MLNRKLQQFHIHELSPMLEWTSSEVAVLGLPMLLDVACAPLTSIHWFTKPSLARSFSLISVVSHYNQEVWNTSICTPPRHTHAHTQDWEYTTDKNKDTTKIQLREPVSLSWLYKGVGMIQNSRVTQRPPQHGWWCHSKAIPAWMMVHKGEILRLTVWVV